MSASAERLVVWICCICNLFGFCYFVIWYLVSVFYLVFDSCIVYLLYTTHTSREQMRAACVISIQTVCLISIISSSQSFASWSSLLLSLLLF